VYEILAIGAGVVLGLTARNIAATQVKVATLILGSVIIGAMAAFVSGEFLESWAYLVFDVTQALFAAGATLVAITWWKQRASRQTRS
jgi:hypothetical protein